MKKIENKNSKNNDPLRSIKHTGKILKTVAKGVGALGYYVFKSIPLISQIKGAYGKYSVGIKQWDDAIDAKNMVSKQEIEIRNPNDKSEILRKGYVMMEKGKNSDVIINDKSIFDHFDTGKYYINFDILSLLKAGNLKDFDRERYTCSDNSYYPEFNDIWDTSTKQFKHNDKNLDVSKNNRFLLKPNFKKTVLKNIEQKFDNFIECAKNQNLHTLFIDIRLHRGDKKIDDYLIENFTPKDFIKFFEKAMSTTNINNIVIQELSCFKGKELVEAVAEAINKTGFKGNVSIRRNLNYDQSLEVRKEVSLKRQLFEGKHFTNNEYPYNGFEYIVCNKDGCKCITENEARKIMGGSYEQNLEFNKKHGLGDKPANPKCQPEMDEINKEYFKKEENEIKNNDADSDLEDEKELDSGIDNL